MSTSFQFGVVPELAVAASVEEENAGSGQASTPLVVLLTAALPGVAVTAPASKL